MPTNLNPYLIWKEQHGKKLITQEDIRGNDYQVNWIAHVNTGPSSEVATYLGELF
jgi:hypothetical protein